MSYYDDAVEYCREQGIPEDEIDNVIDIAELCCDGVYGDGCCADNSKAIIQAEAKKYAQD
jgi:hypothetical protein